MRIELSEMLIYGSDKEKQYATKLLERMVQDRSAKEYLQGEDTMVRTWFYLVAGAIFLVGVAGVYQALFVIEDPHTKAGYAALSVIAFLVSLIPTTPDLKT